MPYQYHINKLTQLRESHLRNVMAKNINVRYLSIFPLILCFWYIYENMYIGGIGVHHRNIFFMLLYVYKHHFTPCMLAIYPFSALNL